MDTIPLNNLGSKSPEELRTMEFLNLYNQRIARTNDPEFQKEIAPEEHRVFTRNIVREKGPVMALAMGAATPGYQLAKLAGLSPRSRTPPSMAQVSAGFQGIGQGLAGWGEDKIQSIANFVSGLSSETSPTNTR